MRSYLRFKSLAVICSLIAVGSVRAQKPNELKWDFNADGTQFFKVTFVNQVWMRCTQNNPGSMAYGSNVNTMYDIGIRRMRVQAFGQVSDRIFLYTQFGMNNFTWMQSRFTGAFFHDAVAEYKTYKDFVSIGAGLTGWSGLGRYASPSVGSILSLDAPLYQQATNSVSDQFLRKLSVYAKGKISHLDYRVALSHPMAVQTGNVSNPSQLDSGIASFSPMYPKMQTQGYFKWEFFDKESNQIPYLAGTYLGKKRVLNLGAGFINQPSAMWERDGKKADTTYHPLSLWNVDVYYDAPLNKEKGTAATFYAAYSIYNFGKNYVRMLGAMNPVNASNSNVSLNGFGNAFPTIGTGNILYAEAAILAPENWIKNHDRIQFFAGSQFAKFEALKDPMVMAQCGLNYYFKGNVLNKLSVQYQNRPVYNRNLNNEAVATDRKGMVTVQFQVGI